MFCSRESTNCSELLLLQHYHDLLDEIDFVEKNFGAMTLKLYIVIPMKTFNMDFLANHCFVHGRE